MALNALALSLQFARDATQHRAVLPRHKVARWIRHALAVDAEITVRIVGAVAVADLVLCAPVVEREAREQNKTLEEHYAHLLVHGALHAQGWDHETSAQDADEMEAYETAIMQELGFADPYAA
jgi:probable rRNA maturation factor